MSDKDKLFNFISGLKAWAQNVLRRQKVSDLPSAIVAVESLMDFKTPQEKTKIKGNKGKKPSPIKIKMLEK